MEIRYIDSTDDKSEDIIVKQIKYMDWKNMLPHLEALYVLDNALTEPEDDLRLIRKFETDNMIKYIVDNGAGDKLTVLFTETAVLKKGFAHENSLNQFAAAEWNQGIIDRMYEGLDEKMKNMFTDDERQETTFFIWYDGEVHQNQIEGNDGGRWLLGYAFDTYERFEEFARDYYDMEFDNDLLRKLYTYSTLSELELSKLIQGGVDKMAVTLYVHLNDEHNYNFNVKQFNEDISTNYPGTSMEVSNSARNYDICWENYSKQYQFELRMDRNRCTFAIEYFNSDNELYEFARFIAWLRSYFDRDKNVILLYETDCTQLDLSCDKSIDDIRIWLEETFG